VIQQLLHKHLDQAFKLHQIRSQIRFQYPAVVDMPFPFRRLILIVPKFGDVKAGQVGRRLNASFIRQKPTISCLQTVSFSSAALIVGGFFAGSLKSKQQHCQCYGDAGTQAKHQSVLHVEGMMCNGCRGNVERALAAVAGVEYASVELDSKLAYVKSSGSSDDLVAAVKSVGKSAVLVGVNGTEGFKEMTVEELKSTLAKSGQRGLVLDIDETLSATNVAWFERLAQLFGNPEGLSIQALTEKYNLAQNVPFWQTQEAHAWMQRQRDDPKAQDGLPLIPGAVEGVHALAKVIPIVGYCTVRPTSVNANTIAWLREKGFPDLPVVANPNEVAFSDGNRWKGNALNRLWPEVIGIVDDNPKVPTFAGKDYPGTVFLFGHSNTQPSYDHAVPCQTWTAVVDMAIAPSTNSLRVLSSRGVASMVP